MRSMKVCALVLSFCATVCAWLGAQSLGGAKAQLADPETARRLLSRDDAYTAALSPFDGSAILKTLKEVGLEEYKEFVGSQTREWSDAERQRIAEALDDADRALAPWNLGLPSLVYLAKTTGADYCGRSYARGNDLIVLPQAVLDLDRRSLSDALIRQAFHLSLRADPERTRRLFALIGFRKVPELEYPERFIPYKITNPNAPAYEWAFESEGGLYMPLLQARTKYNGGELFSYLTVTFLSVSAAEGRTVPAMPDGRMVQVSAAKLPGWTEATGSVSSLLPQPAELMAENFLALTRRAEGAPPSKILEGMAGILKRR